MKENSGVNIRLASTDDAEELLAIYAPYVRRTAVTFEYNVPSVTEFTSRIIRTLESYPYFAAEAGGELLGYAYAGPFHTREAYRWAAETSIYVKQERRCMGIGRKLYDALETALSAQKILNLNACIAYPQQEDEYLTPGQRGISQATGLQVCGGVPAVRIQISPLVQHGMDGKAHRLPFGEPAAGKAL